MIVGLPQKYLNEMYSSGMVQPYLPRGGYETAWVIVSFRIWF